MIRQLVLLALAVLLGVAGAQADTTWSFSYVGVSNPGVFGSGFFTTGTPYGDGYLPITSISGTTEAGSITRLETSDGQGKAPPDQLECCAVGPSGDFYYDNAFAPGGVNGPFSPTGGLLFEVAPDIQSATGYPLSPIELVGDGHGAAAEFSYGEDTVNYNAFPYGGTLIKFTAIQQVPEAGFYEGFALCMGGLLFACRRLRRS